MLTACFDQSGHYFFVLQHQPMFDFVHRFRAEKNLDRYYYITLDFRTCNHIITHRYYNVLYRRSQKKKHQLRGVMTPFVAAVETAGIAYLDFYQWKPIQSVFIRVPLRIAIFIHHIPQCNPVTAYQVGVAEEAGGARNLDGAIATKRGLDRADLQAELYVVLL